MIAMVCSTELHMPLSTVVKVGSLCLDFWNWAMRKMEARHALEVVSACGLEEVDSALLRKGESTYNPPSKKMLDNASFCLNLSCKFQTMGSGSARMSTSSNKFVTPFQRKKDTSSKQ